MQTSDTIETTATPEEILHPGSRALLRYWEATRGEMSAPARDWLDLKHIRSLVPFLFLIERIPGQAYIWRLAGTKVCELWGSELTGRPAFAEADGFERDTVHRLVDRVIDAHQPFVLRFRLNSSLGVTVAAELVGMPLRARQDGVTYAFGAVMPFRDVSRHRHDQVTSFELSTARTIWTEPVPASRESRATISPQPFQVINGGRAN